RLAYETTSVPNRFERAAGARVTGMRTAARPPAVGISTEVLNDQIDRFLSARGFTAGSARSSASPPAVAPAPPPEPPAPAQSALPAPAGSVSLASSSSGAAPAAAPVAAVDFVCE